MILKITVEELKYIYRTCYAYLPTGDDSKEDMPEYIRITAENGILTGEAVDGYKIIRFGVEGKFISENGVILDSGEIWVPLIEVPDETGDLLIKARLPENEPKGIKNKRSILFEFSSGKSLVEKVILRQKLTNKIFEPKKHTREILFKPDILYNALAGFLTTRTERPTIRLILGTDEDGALLNDENVRIELMDGDKQAVVMKARRVQVTKANE